MMFDYRKELSAMQSVRLIKDDVEVIDRVAKLHSIQKSEVIRTFVHEAVKEYLKEENSKS